MLGFICFALIAALIGLSAFDIWNDIKAARMASRFDATSHFSESETIGMMDAVNTLTDCAPNPSQNYYGWTTTETRQGWFEESGIRSISMQETGIALLVRIDRGTTLQDEIVFNIREGRVSEISFTFRWHGRPIPFFSKKEYVVYSDEVSVFSIVKRIGNSRIASDLYATMRYAIGAKTWLQNHDHV